MALGWYVGENPKPGSTAVQCSEQVLDRGNGQYVSLGPRLHESLAVLWGVRSPESVHVRLTSGVVVATPTS